MSTVPLPHALVPLKLYCKAAQGDASFEDRLSESNPYPVNVFHIDAPQTRDIDHHHGEAFRRGKYNIGYWAWELPEFPDGWMRYCDYVDEIWAPSRFARATSSGMRRSSGPTPSSAESVPPSTW